MGLRFLWQYQTRRSTHGDRSYYLTANGTGLIVCLKSSSGGKIGKPLSEEKIGNRSSGGQIGEPSSEERIGFWLMSEAFNKLQTSSVWTTYNLEATLVLKATDGGQALYETQRDFALAILEWFKFYYFEVWRTTGSKGDPFDAIDLRG